MTNLEIENGNLNNDCEALRVHSVHSDHKIDCLERQLEDIRGENKLLFNLISHLKNEYQEFAAKTLGEINDVKIVSARKKSDNSISSFGRNVIRNNTIDNRKSRLNKPISEADEKELQRSQSNNLESLLMQNDSIRDNSSPSLFNANESYDNKPHSFSIIDEISSLNFRAVNSQMNPLTFTDLADLERTQTENMLQNSPSKRISVRPRDAIDSSPRIEMATSMKKTVMESKKVFVANRAFENLLVIGTTRKEAIENLKAHSEKTKLKPGDKVAFPGKILFNFAETAQLKDNVSLPDIERFIAPNHLRMSLYPMNDSNTEKRYFKVVLKSQRKYKRRFICPFQPHAGDIQLSKWAPYIDTVNPQNKLYAMCIKKSDYLIVNLGKRSKDQYAYVETIYCLLTYYPIPQLAFGFLTSVLNLTRRKRKELHYKSGENKEKVDFRILESILKQDVCPYLLSLLEVLTPCSNVLISYPFNDDKTTEYEQLTYKCPNKEEAYLELASWHCDKLFTRFSLDNVKLIISAMLLEKSIIFFSRDITILTVILNTLLGLIFPLKYVCNIIPAIPPNSDVLFEAPMPTIIGVDRAEQYFWRRNLDSKASSISVFLDSHVIFINEDIPEIAKFPTLDFLTEGLEELYSRINIHQAKFDVITSVDRLREKIPLKPTIDRNQSMVPGRRLTQDDIGISKQIFDGFRERLVKNLVNYFPCFKDYNPAYVSEDEFREQIENLIQDKKTRDFFYSYKETQSFNCYPYSVCSLYSKE